MPHLSLCLSPHLSAATPFTALTQSKHACSNASRLGSRLTCILMDHVSSLCFHMVKKCLLIWCLLLSEQVTLSSKVGFCLLTVVWMWMPLYTHVHMHSTVTHTASKFTPANAIACIFTPVCTCLSSKHDSMQQIAGCVQAFHYHGHSGRNENHTIGTGNIPVTFSCFLRLFLNDNFSQNIWAFD